LPADHRPPAGYRNYDDLDAQKAPPGELARDHTLATLEAALFASDEPLNVRRLAGLLGATDAGQIRRLIVKLQEYYGRDGSAFQVEELAGGYQLLTRAEFHPWLARLKRTGNDLRLSPAGRETLAIVAYRQPIMRAEVEIVRGVQCGEMLRQLMEKGLVRIVGRHNSLGRPVLYGTTKRFLQAFGLKNLKELPLADQLTLPAKAQPGK
jgi:segregation and condensation protein B